MKKTTIGRNSDNDIVAKDRAKSKSKNNRKKIGLCAVIAVIIVVILLTVIGGNKSQPQDIYFTGEYPPVTNVAYYGITAKEALQAVKKVTKEDAKKNGGAGRLDVVALDKEAKRIADAKKVQFTGVWIDEFESVKLELIQNDTQLTGYCHTTSHGSEWDTPEGMQSIKGTISGNIATFSYYCPDEESYYEYYKKVTFDIELLSDTRMIMKFADSGRECAYFYKQNIPILNKMESNISTPKYRVGDVVEVGGPNSVLYEVSADGQCTNAISISSNSGLKGVVFEVSADGKYGQAVSISSACCGWDDAKIWCSELECGWKMPTKSDLLIIYNQYATCSAFRNACESVGVHFDCWQYWSCEHSGSSACYVDMGDGDFGYIHKGNGMLVRAVTVLE